jgi:hypothetical protein
MKKAWYQTLTPVILTTWKAEIGSLRPAQATTSQDLHLQKITRAKMDWSCGSSSRVSALQAQSPASKPSYPTQVIKSMEKKHIKDY